MKLEKLKHLAEATDHERQARVLFDRMEDAIAEVDKWANGKPLASMLAKNQFSESESKQFRLAVKKMYSEFEDLKMAVISGMQTD